MKGAGKGGDDGFFRGGGSSIVLVWWKRELERWGVCVCVCGEGDEVGEVLFGKQFLG